MYLDLVFLPEHCSAMAHDGSILGVKPAISILLAEFRD